MELYGNSKIGPILVGSFPGNGINWFKRMSIFNLCGYCHLVLQRNEVNGIFLNSRLLNCLPACSPGSSNPVITVLLVWPFQHGCFNHTIPQSLMDFRIKYLLLTKARVLHEQAALFSASPPASLLLFLPFFCLLCPMLPLPFH